MSDIANNMIMEAHFWIYYRYLNLFEILVMNMGSWINDDVGGDGGASGTINVKLSL